ncbi:MAG: hypothetical protein HZA24_09450 [Nitrospirae bacterium]|nr:hypothetical protein [Nitrospirota bacterium]
MTPSSDAPLVHLLNNGEQVATTESANWIVRVYKVYDLGECGPDRPESCPLRQLMVAVRTIDLAPDQAVFILPKAHDWRFLEWTHVPRQEGPDDAVRFTLERDDPSPTPQNGWWITSRHEVAVNPWKASIRPVSAAATGP